MNKNQELHSVYETLNVVQLDDIIDDKRYSIKELRSLLQHFGLPCTLIKYYEYRNAGIIPDKMCNRGASGKDDVRIKGNDVKKIIKKL